MTEIPRMPPTSEIFGWSQKPNEGETGKARPKKSIPDSPGIEDIVDISDEAKERSKQANDKSKD